MTATPVPLAPEALAGRPRRVAFRALACLLTLAMGLTGGHLLVTGWTDGLDGGLHRLQDLHWGVSEGLLLAAAMGWQLRRPERHPGAMRVAVLAVAGQLVVAAATLSPDPFGVALFALVVAALALHPARRTVLRPPLTPDRRLLAVTVPAALALLAFAATQVGHHYAAVPGDVLEAKVGWIGAALSCTGLALVLVAAGLLRSRAAAALAGAGLAVLGLGSLLEPHAPSSLGVPGGAGALIVAAVLAAAVAGWGSTAGERRDGSTAHTGAPRRRRQTTPAR